MTSPRWILLAAALATGCGQGLESLGAFPCAADFTCPGSRLCVAGQCQFVPGCDLTNLTSCVASGPQDRCTYLRGPSTQASSTGYCIASTLAVPGGEGSACGFDITPGFVDGCAKQTACVRETGAATINGKIQGVCRRICSSDTACTVANTRCLAGVVERSSTQLDPRVGACMPTKTCDAFTQDCATGQNCIVGKLFGALSGTTRPTVCQAAWAIGTRGSAGDPCGTLDTGGCKGHLQCEDGVCRKLCNVGTGGLPNCLSEAGTSCKVPTTAPLPSPLGLCLP